MGIQNAAVKVLQGISAGLVGRLPRDTGTTTRLSSVKKWMATAHTTALQTTTRHRRSVRASVECNYATGRSSIISFSGPHYATTQQFHIFFIDLTTRTSNSRTGQE